MRVMRFVNFGTPDAQTQSEQTSKHASRHVYECVAPSPCRRADSVVTTTHKRRIQVTLYARVVEIGWKHRRGYRLRRV